MWPDIKRANCKFRKIDNERKRMHEKVMIRKGDKVMSDALRSAVAGVLESYE